MADNLSSLGTTVVIVLSALLVGGYALGNSINRRRVRQQSLWLRDALRQRGAEPRFKSLGAFGIAAAAEFGSGAVSRADVTVQLVLRDVAPIWLWRRLQRMPDSLTFRLVLRRPPSIEGDRLNPGVALARRASRAVPKNWVSTHEHVLLAAPDNRQLADLRRIVDELGSLQPWIFSVRRSSPHILVTIPTPDDAGSLEVAFDVFWNVAAAVAGTQARTAGSEARG